MHPVLTFINQYVTLSENDWIAISQQLEKKQYGKGHLLLKQGDKCNKLYFFESGFIRFFVYKEGNDITKFFTSPPYCFTSQRSFANNIKANENIEILEESTVWEMSKASAFGLLDRPIWAEFVRKLIQEVQYNTEHILEELQNRTAEDRYIALIESASPIVQKASQKHLASYLGIAPQSLSRIRKKYMMSLRS